MLTPAASFHRQYITSKYMSLPLIQQANSWVGCTSTSSQPCPPPPLLTTASLPSFPSNAVTICYLMVIGLYYGNAWGAKSLPLLSTSIFQENGKSWNQSVVFNPSSPILNQTALCVPSSSLLIGFKTATDFRCVSFQREDYGLPRMTASYIWANLCQCAAVRRPPLLTSHCRSRLTIL